MYRSKLVYSVLGGVVALGLLAGATATFAQTSTPEATTVDPSTVLVEPGGRWSNRDQYLADALGIDLEALQTAEEEARIAMIDQAVADGHLTAEQGEQLKLGFGRGLHLEAFYDRDEYLADALGISVDELQAAELEAYKAELAAMVEAGLVTQEQADLALAAKVAESYLDADAIEAQVQAAQEAAIAAAVDAGAITQAQADALLAQLAAQPYQFHGGFGGGFGGGRGGHGGHGGGMHGLLMPPTVAPDASSDTTTDTSFGA